MRTYEYSIVGQLIVKNRLYSETAKIMCRRHNKVTSGSHVYGTSVPFIVHAMQHVLKILFNIFTEQEINKLP